MRIFPRIAETDSMPDILLAFRETGFNAGHPLSHFAETGSMPDIFSRIARTSTEFLNRGCVVDRWSVIW
jgi:hypothetical protein